MRKAIKSAYLLLAVLLSLSALAACSTTAAPTAAPATATVAPTTAPAATASVTAEPTAAPTPAIDTSKRVNIKYVHIGGATPYEDEVLTYLDELLIKKINATISVQYLSWGDAWTKGPLMLMADDIDLMFCCPWFLFNDQAKKGAYLPLNDLLPVYAPNLYADCPKAAWEQSSINGQILMIPAYKQTESRAQFWGVTYREDLRKKYNVPEIKKTEDLEAYFAAIKANEPSMTPYAANSSGAGDVEWQYHLENSNYTTMIADAYLPIAYDITDPTCQLKWTDVDPCVDQWVVLAKKWADAGYWSKDCLANQTNPEDALIAGSSALCGHNAYVLEHAWPLIQPNIPTAELGFLMAVPPSGKVPALAFNSNGVALSANSKNPERTLMFIDLYMFDQEINNAANNGIEGTTYVITPDGFVDHPAGQPTDQQYGFGHMFGMGMANYTFSKKDISKNPAIYNEKYNNPQWQEQYVLDAPTIGISLETESIKTELAAISNVVQTYGPVVYSGLSDDPVAALADYRDKMRQAGIEKVLAEYQKQVDAFLAAKNK